MIGPDGEPAASPSDEQFMRRAIDAAMIAEENGDVPIGAVIVYQNQVIGRAWNQREQLNDCLLYTSDAADDLLCVDLGGRRIIKKNTTHKSIPPYDTATNTS